MTGSPLATVEEVKRIAMISPNNGDITDGEIASFIEDAQDLVRTLYGDPVEKTWSLIQYGNTGSTVYDFTGDKRPVYRIDRIEVGGSLLIGSVTENLEIGEVEVSSDILSLHDGERIEWEWVPQLYNNLVAYKAALYVLESGLIISGEDTRNARVSHIKSRIEEFEKALAPDTVYGSSGYSNWDPRGPGEYIDQDWSNFY